MVVMFGSNVFGKSDKRAASWTYDTITKRVFITDNAESKHEAVSFVGSATEIIYPIEVHPAVYSGLFSFAYVMKGENCVCGPTL
jgi:hypothetical protein